MAEHDGYPTPGAVEAAIADAARRAFAGDPSLTVQEHIRLEYLHRFLSRVFSERSEPGWILKGGTSMLARIASSRATTDVDLFGQSRSLNAALEDLRQLASIDLGDFFRFSYTGHTDAVAGDQQAYVEGYRVSFDVYIGVKKKDALQVDLVVNVAMTGEVEVTSPANALDLPKLASHPYRLYPVVDQIADKVCATLALYRGHPSSREKDLVDLVVLAVTQDVDSAKLRRAVESESKARTLTLPAAFEIPATWGARYARLASKVPACADYRSIGAARKFMRVFIDPVLDGSATGKTWDHTRLEWSGQLAQ